MLTEGGGHECQEGGNDQKRRKGMHGWYNDSIGWSVCKINRAKWERLVCVQSNYGGLCATKNGKRRKKSLQAEEELNENKWRRGSKREVEWMIWGLPAAIEWLLSEWRSDTEREWDAGMRLEGKRFRREKEKRKKTEVEDKVMRKEEKWTRKGCQEGYKKKKGRGKSKENMTRGKLQAIEAASRYSL